MNFKSLCLATTLLAVSACGGSDSEPPVVVVEPEPEPVNAAPMPSVTVSESKPVEGETITLDASASTDADGDALTFVWVQVAGPDVAFRVDGAQLQFETEVDADTDYAFDVSVSDGEDSATATQTVTVANIFTEPRLPEDDQKFFEITEYFATDYAILDFFRTDRVRQEDGSFQSEFLGLARDESDALRLATFFQNNNGFFDFSELQDADIYSPDADLVQRTVQTEDVFVVDRSQFVVEPSADKITELVKGAGGQFAPDDVTMIAGLRDAQFFNSGNVTAVLATEAGLSFYRAEPDVILEAPAADYGSVLPWTPSARQEGAFPEDYDVNPEFYALSETGQRIDVYGNPIISRDSSTGFEIDFDRFVRAESFTIDLPDARVWELEGVVHNVAGSFVFHSTGEGADKANAMTLFRFDPNSGFTQSQLTWNGPAFKAMKLVASELDSQMGVIVLESGPEAFAIYELTKNTFFNQAVELNEGGFIEVGLGAEPMEISSQGGDLYYPQRGQAREILNCVGSNGTRVVRRRCSPGSG